MTATSHRIFNLSAAIALSFHWWVWLLFLLAASLPDLLEPATRRQSRFRSHRGLFHTYSVWIVLGLGILWLPTASFTISGLPMVFNAGVKALTAAYRAAWEVQGEKAADLPLLGVFRHVVVADSDAKARDLARPAYRQWRRHMAFLWDCLTRQRRVRSSCSQPKLCRPFAEQAANHQR